MSDCTTMLIRWRQFTCRSVLFVTQWLCIACVYQIHHISILAKATREEGGPAPSLISVLTTGRPELAPRGRKQLNLCGSCLKEHTSHAKQTPRSGEVITTAVDPHFTGLTFNTFSDTAHPCVSMHNDKVLRHARANAPAYPCSRGSKQTWHATGL